MQVSEKIEHLSFVEYGNQDNSYNNLDAIRIFCSDTTFYEGGVFSQDTNHLFEFYLNNSTWFVREKNTNNDNYWQVFYSTKDYHSGSITISGVEYKTSWKDSTYLSGEKNQIAFLQPQNKVFVSHINEFIINNNIGIIGIISDGTLFIRKDKEVTFTIE